MPTESELRNQRYMAERGARLVRGGRVLDFGCGRGGTVRLLRERGLDAYGADVFFGGMDFSAIQRDPLWQEGRLREIRDGHVPFDSSSFDVIISDQVIEHVENLDQSVAEMSRLLKPDGVMYHQFPTREVIREAHFTVPYIHRFPPGQARSRYMRAWAEAGVGRGLEQYATAKEWVEASLDWLDRYCVYRSLREVMRCFDRHGFVGMHSELSYCLYRARPYPALESLLRRPRLHRAAEFLFRRLGFAAIEFHRVTARG